MSLEKLIIIIDRMPEYAGRLAVYLNSRRSFPYRAVVFSRPEEARSYIESGAVYAILAAECFEKEVLSIALQTDVRVLWLSETKEVRGTSLMYRYQSAREIEKRLTETEKSGRKLWVFGVYSPAGGVCMERLSRKIAAGLAGTVLYLPFLPFGSCGRGFRDGMSELLFYLKQREEMSGEVFSGLVQKEKGLDSIGPVRWSAELREVSKEDIENLFRFLETKTEYDTVAVAIGQFDAAGLMMLRYCDVILIPVWETEEGRALQTEFLRQLKEAGEAELLSRITEFPLCCGEDNTDVAQAAADAVKRGREAVCGHTGGDSEPDTGTAQSVRRTGR